MGVLTHDQNLIQSALPLRHPQRVNFSGNARVNRIFTKLARVRRGLLAFPWGTCRAFCAVEQTKSNTTAWVWTPDETPGRRLRPLARRGVAMSQAGVPEQ